LPGGKAPELYAPVAFVVNVVACAVPRFVIVTLASLTTAPDGSVTVPTMLPVLIVVWARTAEPENKRRPVVAAANVIAIVSDPYLIPVKTFVRRSKAFALIFITLTPQENESTFIYAGRVPN
jgi:hypothetical protein